MILGVSYPKALKLIHPYKDPNDYWDTVGMEPEKSIAFLPRLGIEIRPSKTRTLKRLRRDALLLIRWKHEPNLMHAVVYDSSRKKFLDPSGKNPFPNHVYETQLDTVLYIRKMKTSKRKQAA